MEEQEHCEDGNDSASHGNPILLKSLTEDLRPARRDNTRACTEVRICVSSYSEFSISQYCLSCGKSQAGYWPASSVPVYTSRMPTNPTGPRAGLLAGDPARLVVTKAVPMLAGILGMVVFNLVDTFFVGILGTEELAAMGFTFPVVMVVGSIAMGLGAGASSVISRAIGGADSAEVRFLTTAALILAVTIVTAIITVGFPLLSPALHTPRCTGPYPLPRHRLYAHLAGRRSLRGDSDGREQRDPERPGTWRLPQQSCSRRREPTQSSTLFSFSASVPFLPLASGEPPWQRSSGRMLTLGLSMTVLHRRYRMLDWGFVELRRCAAPLSRLIDAWLRLIRIGLPAAATNLVLPVSLGIVTRMVSAYGTAAVAGFAVAGRIEIFALAYLQALAAVATPFFGQHAAARLTPDVLIHRLRRAIGGAAAASALWALLVFLLVLAAGRMIAGVFATDPAVVDVTADYLTIVAGSYAFQGMMLFVSAAFNGLNQPLRSAVTSLTRMVIFYIPLALLLRALWGINGVFAAAALANVGTGTLAVWWLLRRTGRLISA
jgi:Na+-driven multidrug efflux pump